jgi:hypothetical protein
MIPRFRVRSGISPSGDGTELTLSSEAFFDLRNVSEGGSEGGGLRAKSTGLRAQGLGEERDLVEERV